MKAHYIIRRKEIVFKKKQATHLPNIFGGELLHDDFRLICAEYPALPKFKYKLEIYEYCN